MKSNHDCLILIFHTSDVQANSYPHRGTRGGEGEEIDGTLMALNLMSQQKSHDDSLN